MAQLRNWQWERFAQELSRRLCEGMATRAARPEAYRAAGYPDGTAMADNARKLAGNPKVKARVDELNAEAAELAGVNRAWCVLTLMRRVDGFNLDDYLSGTPGSERHYDISQASREQLGRLHELSLEEEIIEAGEETMMRVRKTKLKGYDPKGIVETIARIQGYLTDKSATEKGDGTLTIVVKGGLPETAAA